MNNKTVFKPDFPPLSRGMATAIGVPVATASLLCSMSVLAQSSARPVEEIIVTDSLRTRYLINESTLGSKFTESLRDIPQSITLLSQAMMEDRNVMSLDDALRNVPGITLGAGEFKWMGNGPTIRGFPSRNDMYVDGIRDLGFYSRDPFNLEAIEVLQGPSSMAFGRGSTGGIINQSSKKPFAEELRSLHVNLGNANLLRAVADINQPLSDTAALRVNLLAHESEVPGRDIAETSRYGVAPSLALELGSATKLTLNYLYQDSESIPDYGLPWVDGAPANVDRETFYGFENDWLDSKTHIFSAIVDHRLSDSLTLNAQLRYADYDRDNRLTEPQVDSSVSASTPPQDVTVERLIYGSEGREEVLQGQVNLRADFATGGITHTVVTGLELSQESSNTYFAFAGAPTSLDITTPVPSTNLANPTNGVFNDVIPRRLSADGTSDTVGVFALDTIKFNEQWQVVLGLRWDRFETDYEERRFEEDGSQSDHNRYVTEDKEPSYRTALVYKPVPEGTIYLGWGTSFNPATESVTQIASGRGLSTSNVNLDPQENESLELGLKWGLIDGGLLLDASVFQIEKTNAYVKDPLNSGFNTEAGDQTVKGFAISANGSVGELMQIMVGYTYLDGESENTLTGAKSIMDNVPENSFNFWLNWTASSKVSLGAGARFIDERFWGSKSVPDYWSFDAMAKYRLSDTVSFKLNLTNLTDEYYFDQLHSWHVFPGAGRTAVFAVNLDY